MKKMSVFWVLILGLFLVSFASALTVSSTSENTVIIPEFNQPAKFFLTISDTAEGDYSIYTLTDVKMLPASKFHLSSGTNIVEVYVYPTDRLSARGYYTFSYNIGNFTDRLTVKIVNLEDSIEISSDSISADSEKVTFYIMNLEDSNLEGVKARFKSILFDVKEEFDLGPHEKVEFEVDVDPDKLKRTKAGSYVVSGEFETDDGLKSVDGTIYIGEKKGIKTEEDSSGFLIRTKSVTKINVGNVFEIVEVNVRKNIFSRIFTSFNVEPIAVDRSGFVVDYTWNERLGPAEVFTVKARTNYVWPLMILILAGLAFWGFRRFGQTKVEIRKSVNHVRTKGGEFALKVHVSVKARKNVENVSLIDKIPMMVKVYKKFGTLKPDKIDVPNRRLHWNIGNLNAGEVRMFSYIVYSKIGMVGKVALPSALAIFESEGNIREIESNRVFFLSEQTERDD